MLARPYRSTNFFILRSDRFLKQSDIGNSSLIREWENENLPSFVVMEDNGAQVVNGPRNWGSGFMPAVYQRIRFREGKQPIPYLHSPEGIDDRQQTAKLDFINRLNHDYAQGHPEQTELEARIASYELAFKMQAELSERSWCLAFSDRLRL